MISTVRSVNHPRGTLSIIRAFLSMKIASFNINGVNGRLELLTCWLKEARPDVVCLQELKTPDEKFPDRMIEAAGYGAVWHGQKSWNGVAILARDTEPVETRRGLPSSSDDLQSRYIEAAISGVLVGCLYAPNGNPAPGPKYKYKLKWLTRFMRHTADLIEMREPVALVGDYNIVPTELDVYRPETWLDDALFRPEVRAIFQSLTGQGWTDALRTQHPNERVYTFWDYMRNAWARDAGLRLDHVLLSPTLAPRLQVAGVDRHVRGWKGASDHAPAWVTIQS
jgi:exodeoxyribonuclease-3